VRGSWDASEASWGRRSPTERDARRLSGMHLADATKPPGRGLGERVYLLATTGRCDGRGNRGELEMPQDTRDHRLLGDDGNKAQGAPAAKRTGGHLQGKGTSQELGPVPLEM
jgi:hypothetical protein